MRSLIRFSGRRNEKCIVEGGDERLLVGNWRVIEFVLQKRGL